MNRPFYAFSRQVVRQILRVGWRLRVVGAERVPLSGPLIVACNHVSYFDPPALGAACPRPLRYMAKAELFSIPVLGPMIGALGSYPVDRSRGDVSAIKRSLDVLKTGAALGIFPEGTRNPTGSIVPQSGVALLAALSGAPVLPAYVDGSTNPRRFGQITVVFGEPLQFERVQKARREDLAKHTDEIMTRVFELRERL
jgi:1-acyl-sn-glycerol-3-phosphate acyltransferase